MALVLLPLAACDDDDDIVVPDTVTGSISGIVTIDATGASGITVTLSSGASETTSLGGQYTFTDVAEGAYTVSISGQAADVAFPSTGQSAVIATDGQVVTVNFAGSTIRTSVIVGNMTADTGPLAGVTVTLSGTESRTMTTDANGQFSAAGLRAGSYTVAISGTPSTVTCATPSQSVTVAAGESKVVSFSCTVNTTASISGRMFIDENDKNYVFDGSTLEDNVEAANVLITLEGPDVGMTQTQQTDSTGAYSFTDLSAGSYNVTIDDDDDEIPSEVEYGGTSVTKPIVVATGQDGMVDFPFDILSQTLLAYAFTGRDADDDPAVAPVKGVILDVFASQVDADNNLNILDSDTTDANGEVQFTFLRVDDTSPGGGQDQIVFAKVSTITSPAIPADMELNGEVQIEVRYDARSGTDMAPDSFDLLNTRFILKSDAFGVSGDELEKWDVELYTDTISTLVETVMTDADGRVDFNDQVVATGSLPTTFYVRLDLTQREAMGHVFTQNAVSERGTVVGSYLAFVHDGLTGAADTVDVGDHVVTFADADVFVQVFQEADDTLGMTAGDATTGMANLRVWLSYVEADGETIDREESTPNDEGHVTITNVPTQLAPYVLSLRSVVATQFALGRGHDIQRGYERRTG